MIVKVIRRSDGAEVPRYAAQAVTEIDGFPFVDFDHIEINPDDPIPTSGATRLPRLQFIARLGDSAVVAILALSQQSVEVAAWVKLLDWTTPDADGTSIDLLDPRTIAGLNALEPALIAQGVVTEGWAREVLNAE